MRVLGIGIFRKKTKPTEPKSAWLAGRLNRCDNVTINSKRKPSYTIGVSKAGANQ